MVFGSPGPAVCHNGNLPGRQQDLAGLFSLCPGDEGTHLLGSTALQSSSWQEAGATAVSLATSATVPPSQSQSSELKPPYCHSPSQIVPTMFLSASSSPVLLAWQYLQLPVCMSTVLPPLTFNLTFLLRDKARIWTGWEE